MRERGVLSFCSYLHSIRAREVKITSTKPEGRSATFRVHGLGFVFPFKKLCLFFHFCLLLFVLLFFVVFLIVVPYVNQSFRVCKVNLATPKGRNKELRTVTESLVRSPN